MSQDKDSLYRQLLTWGTQQPQAPETLRRRVRDAMAEAASRPADGAIDGTDASTGPCLSARHDPEASCSLADAVQRATRSHTGPLDGRRSWRHVMMHSRLARFGAVAAAAIVALAVVGLWPASPVKPKAWWMGPPAACAQEVRDALRTVSAVSFRDQSYCLKADGSRLTFDPGYWRTYNAQRRARHDHYNEAGVVDDIRWKIEQDGKATLTVVRPGQRRYSVTTDLPTGDGVYDTEPSQALARWLALDKVQRVLEPRWINGRECVGFEYDGQSFGRVTRSDGTLIRHIIRTWFDVQTKLPHFLQTESDADVQSTSTDVSDIKTEIRTLDQFDYSPQPEDLFVPLIPEGFARVKLATGD